MVWMRRSFAVTLALLAGALSVTAQDKPSQAATVEGKPADRKSVV